MNRLLDRILTTLLRDFAPTHPVAQSACLVTLVALVLLSVWAVYDTWSSSDSEGGLPPPGPHIQAMLGITLLRRLPLFLVRSPVAPQFCVCATLLLISATVITPAILQVREKSRRQQCKQNLKQLDLAFHNYRDVFGSFPQTSKPVVVDSAAEPVVELDGLIKQHESTRFITPSNIFTPTDR